MRARLLSELVTGFEDWLRATPAIRITDNDWLRAASFVFRMLEGASLATADFLPDKRPETVQGGRPSSNQPTL
jgi:hypothetical protein